MRVGVSGTGGSGKTTLTERLSAALNVPAVAEGVNEWLGSKAMAGSWSVSVDDQLELQRHAIAYKIARERDLPSFVSDRTTVDAVTLLTLRLERAGAPMPAELRDTALRHAVATYDLAVILGPRRISPESDDVALLDPTLRVRELALTRSIYASLGVPMIDVPQLPPGEITSFVISALQERFPR